MGLDEVDVIWGEAPGVFEAAMKGVLLAVGVGGGNGLALPIGAGTHTFNKSQDIVPVT